tara:strand:- start:1489 stop:2163 length:675 start_codon:yes stop_codon:yes gene_type:complete
MNIVVAASKDWFFKSVKSKEYNNLSIINISYKEELTLSKLEQINPEYIFFPHWNWKVSPEIFMKYNCVLIHTAPLPYGRGGSPIQNLILRGFKKSKVCALKMTDTLDAGPIYSQLDISLEGNIDEIFSRLAKSVEIMILEIIKNKPIPKEQVGEVVYFKRLNAKDNELKGDLSLNDIYDRIRMVDSKDYPKAYIKLGSYKIEFSNANIKQNKIQASITIFESEE